MRRLSVGRRYYHLFRLLRWINMHGKYHMKGTAHSWSILHLDVPSMTLNNFARDEKT
jgi:hypothetical protein